MTASAHLTHLTHLAQTPEAAGIDPDKLAALFERAEKEVREGLLPSCQIAIARGGRIAAMRTFGRTTFEGEEREADDSTLYCVFSCTKAFTSAAAWQLMEQGKLSPDEIVADIVPEFGSNGKDGISVEQLLTHTAGFPNAPYPPAAFLDHPRRLETFARWRLNWEPGTRFEYHPSSSMYVVAEIIERRSGEPYADYVHQHIARPLGLDDLWIGLPRDQQHRVADIVHVGEAMTEADYAELGMPMPPVTEVTEDALQHFNRPEVRMSGIPGGGAITTAASLALFYQALVNGGRAHDGSQVWRAETIEMAREIRSGDLKDRLLNKHANRSLGLIIAGDDDRNARGFGHTNSALAFGHGGAGGQIGWADPATGISLGYCTNGHDRNNIRQARRGIGISSRAALCALAD
jgi:CubicO group peptidase (beta-lactamase class C family)